ncbi:2OG-Fe(II) oxygenase [bacterium]|nr:2OG-Fe(II) oxygenase [bacterium]MBU1994888.1 2OG-Fe(II) oxygenase [bacterium]
MRQEFYEQITDALVRDGYIVIPHAINQHFSHKLLNTAKKIKRFKRAGISNAPNVHIDSKRRRDKIHWLDYDNGGIQSEFLDFTKGLQEYLNRELFLGLTYYESHFAVYEEGAFYETHLDAFAGFKNRVVTTVYYLNENWVEGDGGELVIYNENNSYLKTVVPHADTLVVFLSDKFPHEVLAAKKKRYSIAGWFRVDKRVGIPLPVEALSAL